MVFIPQPTNLIGQAMRAQKFNQESRLLAKEAQQLVQETKRLQQKKSAQQLDDFLQVAKSLDFTDKDRVEEFAGQLFEKAFGQRLNFKMNKPDNFIKSMQALDRDTSKNPNLDIGPRISELVIAAAGDKGKEAILNDLRKDIDIRKQKLANDLLNIATTEQGFQSDEQRQQALQLLGAGVGQMLGQADRFQKGQELLGLQQIARTSLNPAVREQAKRRIKIRTEEIKAQRETEKLAREAAKEEAAGSIQTARDAKGFVRNVKTGKRIFQGVEAPAKEEKVFSPDIQQFRHIETGKILEVNVRDPKEIAAAEKQGFRALGPMARGFFLQAGKNAAQAQQELVKFSNGAKKRIATLDAMNRLLDRFESGRLAGVKKKVQQLASALGIDVNLTNLAAKEAFSALTEKMALQSKNQEGATLTGAMSDRDVQFLRDMNPQLITSKQGNRIILKISKRIAERQVKVAESASEFKKQNNGIFEPLKFDKFVSEKFSDTSIFGLPKGVTLVEGKVDSVTGFPVYRLGEDLFIPEF